MEYSCYSELILKIEWHNAICTGSVTCSGQSTRHDMMMFYAVGLSQWQNILSHDYHRVTLVMGCKDITALSLVLFFDHSMQFIKPFMIHHNLW